MVTWVLAMLFGMMSIPYSVATAGLVSLSLFASPLKSSFAKPNTPTNTGVIQHWSMVLIYILLELTVPGLLYFTLIHNESVLSWLVLCLLVMTPLFILTLLESQGILTLLCLGSRLIRVLRWLSGTVVMVLLSMIVLLSQSSSHLPLLLIPLSFATFALITSLDHTPSTTTTSSSQPHTITTLTLATITALLASSTFIFLPWSISHSFSFISLPLSIVQLLIWCITMVTIAMVIFHNQLTPNIWILFNIVFVIVEYILCYDGMYLPYLALTTATMATVLFWRLHTVGLIPINSCLVICSVHMTKLSLLLPTSPTLLHTSPITNSVAIFLLCFLLLRLSILQSQATSISYGQLLVYCGLFCSGLLLCMDSLLTPLWMSFTHQPPSSASLIATIVTMTALYMNYGLTRVRPSETGGRYLYSDPPCLILMSLLLFIFQPEFDPQQFGEAFFIVLTGSDETSKGLSAIVTSELLLAAWGQLLSWCVFLTAGFVLVTMVMYKPLVSTLSTILGVFLGAMATIILLTTPPSLLYTIIGGCTGCLLGRAYATPPTRNRRSLVDNIIYIVLVVTMMAVFIMEYLNTSHVYILNLHWFHRVSVPCTRLGMGIFASIALAFRIKMNQCGEQSYVAMAANTSCLLFYIFALFNPLHIQYEVSVVLSSLIFLLLQPDGYLLPSTISTTLFLAPSLLMASSVLYILAGHRVILKTLSVLTNGVSMFLATRCLELVCLLGSLPGQAVFIYYLWSGKQLHLSIPQMILYILPNAFLPQFGGTPSSTILGIMGVLAFCLIMLGDYTSFKITS